MKSYQNLRRVSQSLATKCNQMYFLDLSNPEHFDCVVEQFGGQEHIMQEYPHFWELLLRTRQHHASNGAPVKAQSVEDREEFLYVSSMYVNKANRLVGIGRLTLPKKATQLSIMATVYQGEECVGHNAAFGYDDTRLMVECVGETPFQDGVAETVLHLAIQRSDEDILTAAVVVCRDSDLVNDPIQRVAISHPTTKNNWYPPEPIRRNQTLEIPHSKQVVNVCYARSPLRGEVCHYYYPHGLVNGKQEIYLDVRGTVEFKASTPSLQFDRVAHVSLGINTPYGGTMSKTITDPSQYISRTNTGFEFAFPTDWGTVIPGGIMASRALCYLYCQIEYYIKGSSDIKTLWLSSSNPSPHVHWVNIPDIKLNWGCVTKDTQILMADGTQRSIEQIKVGDLVLGGKTRTPVRVTDVINGVEADVWCVETSKGEKIHVTDEHPFCTEKGDKRAIDLMETDRVLMQNETYETILYRYERSYEDTVFNLELEKDHYFIANNFVIGDQSIQGAAMRSTLDSDCVVPPEIKQEIEKMRRQLGKSNN